MKSLGKDRANEIYDQYRAKQDGYHKLFFQFEQIMQTDNNNQIQNRTEPDSDSED